MCWLPSSESWTASRHVLKYLQNLTDLSEMLPLCSREIHIQSIFILSHQFILMFILYHWPSCFCSLSCLSWSSQYRLKTHLNKIELSQGAPAVFQLLSLVLQAHEHLKNCGHIAHIRTQCADTDTFTWDHRITRAEMRKKPIFSRLTQQ